MAKILIVDDSDANREFLVDLLRYHQHEMLEADDGAVALEVVRRERPDLIISDVLMPTMDGYDFVRRLRLESDVAATPVIFASAYFLEREARALAAKCGVQHVLQKPMEPELVLATVKTILGEGHAGAAPLARAAVEPAEDADSFEAAHRRLLVGKLSETNEGLRAANARLRTVVDLVRELGSQRDPQKVLEEFCRAARGIVGARFALVGLHSGARESPSPPFERFVVSGLEIADVPHVSESLQSLLPTLGLSAERPSARSQWQDRDGLTIPVLITSLRSLDRSYGCLFLFAKLGLPDFSFADEELAVILSSQTGRVFENGKLYADLQRRTAELESEVEERMRAEETLRASEQRFRALTENASDLIMVADRHGRIQYASPSHERLLGFSAEQLVGRELIEFAHPEDRAQVDAWFQGIVSDEGAHRSIEFRWHCRDDSWRALECVGMNLIADPAVGGIVLNGRDLSERRRAEKNTATLLDVARDLSGTLDPIEVLRVQSRVRRALQASAVATFIRDGDTQSLHLLGHDGLPTDVAEVLYASPPLLDGIFAGRVIPGGETVIVDDVRQLAPPFAQLARSVGATSIMVAPMQVGATAIGAMAVYRTQASGLFGREDSELFTGICKQVGMAMRSVQLFQAQQGEYAVTRALAKAGQRLITSLGSTTLANEICGLTRELVGCDRSYIILQDPADGAFVPAANDGESSETWESMRVVRVPGAMIQSLAAQLERSEVLAVDANEATNGWSKVMARHGLRQILYAPIWRGRELSGLQIAAQGTDARPFSDTQRRIAAGIAQLGSIALENARLLNELDEANRLKSEFVATMSHELRTPLNIIMGYNGLVIDGEFGAISEEQNEILQRVNYSALQLLGLINNLLDLGRLEVGQERLAYSECDVGMLLKDVLKETVENQANPLVHFDYYSETDLPTLFTDTVKLRVVVRNLLANAVKFTADGRIALRLVRVSDEIEISVSDTGVGVASEVLPFIFEAFRQGEDSMTRNFGGVGLGLYIARRLVELLGGTISVESTLGEGSCFRVRLPTTAIV